MGLGTHLVCAFAVRSGLSPFLAFFFRQLVVGGWSRMGGDMRTGWVMLLFGGQASADEVAGLEGCDIAAKTKGGS